MKILTTPNCFPQFVKESVGCSRRPLSGSQHTAMTRARTQDNCANDWRLCFNCRDEASNASKLWFKMSLATSHAVSKKIHISTRKAADSSGLLWKTTCLGRKNQLIKNSQSPAVMAPPIQLPVIFYETWAIILTVRHSLLCQWGCIDFLLQCCFSWGPEIQVWHSHVFAIVFPHYL